MNKVALITLIAVIFTVQFAFADSAADSQSVASTAVADPGTSASEMLAGNGTRAGYMLSHGNVISGSEWVTIGTHHGVRNRDYSIDYSTGSIFFTESVPQSSCIQVDYRYSTNASTQQTSPTAGLLAMRFGANTQSNVLYAYSSANNTSTQTSQNILTYGISTITKLNSASTSSLTSMFYVASPQNTNMALASGTGQTVSSSAKKAKKDRLIVQDADLSAGKVHLKLGYQDVGQDFAGFASLRNSKAAATDVIDMLEKEKGIRRMSIAGEVPAGVNQKLTFGMSQITDKTDDIISQSFGYQSDIFKFSFGAREVGASFSRFADIREADRAQMAAEAGTKRQSVGMQFRTGIADDKSSVWSSMSMTQLTGEDGSMSYNSADLDIGNIKVQADIRSMDPTFSKLSALSDAERNRMALMARRQFDPMATDKSVTSSDKTQLNNEQGLDRETYVVMIDGSSIDTWLSMSNVDSPVGGISRKAIGMNTGSLSMHLSTQTIGNKFKKFSQLQPIEQTRFGNEYGMTRTEMGGSLKITGTEVTIASANVTDNIGNEMSRRSIALKNPNISIRANFQDIDQNFSRISDLSDTDKSDLEDYLGYRKNDLSISYKATKALKIDSYFLDSTNAVEDRVCGRTRHKIAYAPLNGPKIDLLTDDSTYITDDGDLAGYTHNEIKFGQTINILGGLKFSGRSDVYTDREDISNPQTTKISQTHIESSSGAKTAFVINVMDADYGNGHKDSTSSFAIKSFTSNRFALIAGMSAVDTNSTADGKFGVEWSPRKDFKFSVNTANTNSTSNSPTFSFSGNLAKQFLCLKNIVVTSGTGKAALSGDQGFCEDAFKVGAGFAGGELTFDTADKINSKTGIYNDSRILQYESNKDKSKPMHLTIYRQSLTTPLGVNANKRKYSLDFKAAGNAKLTLTSYFGKDGANGTITNVGGTIVKYTRPMGPITITADYTADENRTTRRCANIVGMGISRTVSPKSSYECYFGLCNLTDSGIAENKHVFKIKYNAKMDARHYISLSLQRKSGVDKTTINSWEGDTVGRLDINFAFD